MAELHPVMAGWKLHRHALAAWLAFEEALENHQAAALCNRIRLYYRRHWHNPAEFTPE